MLTPELLKEANELEEKIIYLQRQVNSLELTEVEGNPEKKVREGRMEFDLYNGHARSTPLLSPEQKEELTRLIYIMLKSKLAALELKFKELC